MYTDAIHTYTHIYHTHLFFCVYIYLYKCKKLWTICDLCLYTQPTKELSTAVICERTRLLNFFQLHQDQHRCLGSQEGQFRSKITSPHPVSLENPEFLHRAFYPGLQTGRCWASPWSPRPRWLCLQRQGRRGHSFASKLYSLVVWFCKNPLNPWIKLAIARTTTTALFIGGRMRRNLVALRQIRLSVTLGGYITAYYLFLLNSYRSL